VNPDNVEALYMLAVQEEQQGHHDAYHDYYRKAVSINPGFVAIRHNRIGHFLVKNGKYDEAIRQFEHALEVRPDYLSARINLGVAYAEKGEFHTAATILLPLWRKRPRDRPLQESLFNVMRRLALTREPVSNGNP
jgi:Tfp pilus assembly protein PilF